MRYSLPFAFLLLLALASNALYSQNPTFLKVSTDPDMNLDTRGMGVLPIGNGQYLIAGLADTLNGSITDHGLLFLVDSTGQVIWQQQYYEGAFTQLLESVKAPDGGYAVLGIVGKNGSEMEALLLKTDAVGNPQWNLRWNLVALFSGAQEPSFT